MPGGRRHRGDDSNGNGDNSNTRPSVRTRPAPDDPTSGPAAEVSRLMKRMRPEELRELCQAASVLEKAKLEDRKKVEAFVAENEDFAQLVEDCYICMEPLLNNIGSTKFGVISWHCRCTIAQKAHSACIFSKVSRGQMKCDMCNSQMFFEKSRRKGWKATIVFNREGQSSDMDELEVSSNSQDSGTDSDAEEVWAVRSLPPVQRNQRDQRELRESSSSSSSSMDLPAFHW